MGARRASLSDSLKQSVGRSWLVVIPFVLIVAIAVVDVQAPKDVHLGPLLVIAPALTAAVAGTLLTAFAGALAVTAQILIAVFHGGLGTSNHVAQIVGLAVLSALVVFVSLARERRNRQLNRARSVAETAQRVLLRPPRRHIGPLHVAWLYLTAEDETAIGGDLFAVARGADASTRAIIGDVRGSGLASIGEASMVLGAFREAAHRDATLSGLAAALQESVHRNLDEVADDGSDAGEHFITALVVDLPDHGAKAQMVSCGHPPPLLVRDRRVSVLNPHCPDPPLGVGGPPDGRRPRADSFTFESGDLLVLYTDGVVEARSPSGAFYPLAERIASFPDDDPDTLLRHIHDDLIAHTGGQSTDDAALLIIERTGSDLDHPEQGGSRAPPSTG